MQPILSELSSLQGSLEQLQGESSRAQFPEAIREKFMEMVQNCESVVIAMRHTLSRLNPSSIRSRAQWVSKGREDMLKLRSRIEAHKTTINLAVSIASL